MKMTYKYWIVILAFVGLHTACNEDEFLKEEPLDFFSPSNSFVTFENFESSLIDLYAQLREYRFANNDVSRAQFYGTDIMFDARESTTNNRFGDYAVTLNPTGFVPGWHWNLLYKIVTSANTIIARLEDNQELSAEQKQAVTAEASFFRAWAYRYLVHLYGGVPIILDEVTSPRTDFTRATRDAVLAQIVTDATVAATDLPGIGEVTADGRVSNLAAYQLLTETYLAQQNWADAIASATVVIDDPNMALMTNRFGSRAAEPEGDVYYDLFRRGNQNRTGGNTEAIWVAQMEVDVPGGFLTSTNQAGNTMERNHAPASWTLQDPDGNPAVLGWRSDLNVGGRGVSFMQPTAFFENTLWESDFDNDLRNSPINYIRDFRYDDPASVWFDSSAVEYPGPNLLAQGWRWYPWLSKVTTPGQHPDALYANRDLGLLTAAGGSTYTDQYYMRLAETYLLRAEAYLGSGDQTSAAADINVVRNRANATPVAPGDVTIDYILDERARELSLEEDRRITLQRLGKLVERVQLYNAHNSDDIQNFHALWPIPAAEIEANINALLEQNDGY
ncbi:RagB/SusD family nutrient uptake outer membrane protein [Tunicatimonas pelagia]|uniref:RagB/SusD family nutrient uptake outer membrane protein n=1 Tax=Tunicatimonas pelagia TaxID=931531 RepID=UPI0026666E08|nr:RagB/SusD family nutrient uptake outer membrane protein [Tunicatimonas pelagia]WKN43858.1 RagB/SusD family nutrient uptake outer membrane protein [Tunicatimonas pelagia]